MSNLSIGSKTKLQYATETTTGVFDTTKTPINLLFSSETLQKSINTVTSDLIRPDRRVATIRGGNVSSGGDINSELSPLAHGPLIQRMLSSTAVAPTALTLTQLSASPTAYTRGTAISAGTPSKVWFVTKGGTAVSDDLPANPLTGQKATTASGAELVFTGIARSDFYMHSYTGGIELGSSLCVEKIISSSSLNHHFLFTGGRVNTFRLDVPQEGMVAANFGLLFYDMPTSGAGLTTGFNDSGTTLVDETFTSYDAQLAWKNAYAGSTYSALPYLSQFSMDVTNNFDENAYAIGSRFRRGLPEGVRTITGSATAFFESLQEFNWFANEAVVSLELSFVNTSGVMVIELPEVKFTGGSPTPQVSGPGVVSASFDWQAFYTGRGSANYDIQTRFINTQSTASPFA